MRTERLFLRPNFAEDWRALYRGIAEESLVRMLARAPWPYREEDARRFCDQATAPTDLRLAVTLPAAGGELIGQIGADLSEDVPELGYWIASNWRGQGFASEAVGAMLELARMLGATRLQAGHYLDNPASGRVLRKCGFVETGEVRPTHALGRGGEMVLARRYERELDGIPTLTAANKEIRKPA